MPDISAYEKAARRLLDEPLRINRLAIEARRFADIARKDHPAGFEKIDAEIHTGLGSAAKMAPGSPEQLLRVERLHQEMAERLREAETEKARRHEENRRRNDRARLEGQRAVIRRDLAERKSADIRAAVALLRDRLDRFGEGLHAAHDDRAFLGSLDSLDDALRAATTACGLEKRATRSRLAQAKAEADIAALVAA